MIDVHHFLSEVPQFGSLRPLPHDDLRKNKAGPDEKSHGLGKRRKSWEKMVHCRRCWVKKTIVQKTLQTKSATSILARVKMRNDTASNVHNRRHYDDGSINTDNLRFAHGHIMQSSQQRLNTTHYPDSKSTISNTGCPLLYWSSCIVFKGRPCNYSIPRHTRENVSQPYHKIRN